MGLEDSDSNDKLRIDDLLQGDGEGARKFDLCFDGNSHHGWGGNVQTLCETDNGQEGCSTAVPSYRRVRYADAVQRPGVQGQAPVPR